MIDRLTDWKTTIAGLLICAVIIAALVTRPEWGATDLAAFAGAIGTAVLGALSRSSAPAPAGEKPAAPAVPPVVGGVLLGAFVGFLIVAAPLSLAGCTPAAQATAARVGGAALAAVDGPACELVEVRSGSALAGVVCESAAGLLSSLLAGVSSQALTSSGARAPAARCRLVPVHAGGAHVGFACEEHASALVAALARDGGA